ncbi:hypothetical protein BKK54_06610 [Rodentibacter genomosp. 1]|uniref:Uncharacterized protein n=1 Tax=Rodentibacter genomosp. 1 TaxID=1908264 RepID=A0A1V3J5Q4_9PAST|nr:hypothetical protein [Rodentibacter genomosp. 1]OOF50367.1 hypothetical protein BKK54_06610 [Rodentibacter genomosp. 1]
MSTTNKDYEFLKEIFTEFFKQKHIVNRLNEIDDHEIYGWEIWLQVELFLFFHKFSDKLDIAEVYREEPCLMDRRKGVAIKCSIDFIIRQKRAHSFIPIEIKQSVYAPRCINHMMRDIDKYSKIRMRDLPTDRVVWCLGVHQKPRNQGEFDKKLEDYSPKISCQPIKNTNYMFTLF